MSGDPEDDGHTTFMRLDLEEDDGSGEVPSSPALHPSSMASGS